VALLNGGCGGETSSTVPAPAAETFPTDTGEVRVVKPKASMQEALSGTYQKQLAEELRKGAQKRRAQSKARR
jgi:hypothetical protein